MTRIGAPLSGNATKVLLCGGGSVDEGLVKAKPASGAVKIAL